MVHSFDTEIAEELGLTEAIVFQYFVYWILNNKENDRIDDYQDGHWWTYGTATEIAKSFPYLSPHQVRRAIASLVEQGALVQGNYNKRGFDRTMWYTLGSRMDTHFAKLQNAYDKYAKSILQNCEMQFANSQNPICKSAKSILQNCKSNTNYITQLNNTVNNTTNAREGFNPFALFEETWHFINQDVAQRLNTLLEECGEEALRKGMARTKGNNIPSPAAIKYIETTTRGIANGNDYAKRTKKRNDVAGTAEVIQRELDEREGQQNDDSTKRDTSIWGIFADK